MTHPTGTLYGWRFGAACAAIGVGGYLAYRALKPRYDFRNRHVVITGGTRGLGLVLARQLAAHGARLSLCSRDPSEVLRAREELACGGASVVGIECDVTDRGRVEEFIATARARHGPVDVLINNAGVIQVGPMDVMRLEDYGQSLHTHFWASLYTTLAVVPEMKARRSGRIVNIASIGGKIAVPHLLPYSVGKFALVGFSQGLRVELAKYGVTVTTVCPALMRTGSHVNASFKGQTEKEYRWFATGGSLPGLSMNANRAARKILDACARGDAEVLVGWIAKAAVAANALFPNLTASLLGLVDHYILPNPAGSTSTYAAGRDSRGRLPSIITKLNDRAATANNEQPTASQPPAVPVS